VVLEEAGGRVTDRVGARIASADPTHVPAGDGGVREAPLEILPG
jgi:hypothetical protein